jgi:ABC-type transporter Mla subunit MlaD
MSRQRSNLKAGLFLTVGIVLVLAVIFTLADLEVFFTSYQRVVTRTLLADGLKGLKTGAAVSIGGANHGKVTAIRDELNSDGVVVAKLIEFVIPADYKIYENAHIDFNVPPLGSGTTLNIRSFGGPPPPELAGALKPHGKGWQYEYGVDPPIPAGLATSEAISAAVKELGIDDLQRQQVKHIIANTDKLLAALGDDPRPLAEIIANFRDISASLKTDLPKISGGAADIVATVRERYGKWLDAIDSITGTASAALTKADKAVGTVQGMLDENRQPLQQGVASAQKALANAQEITQSVKDQTLVKVHAALDTAHTAVENVRVATEEIKNMVVTQRPVLERTIANARLTSDQLKLAAIEVRRAPWRLLYTPTEKEMESDKLYDAARSFALAAGSLNSTADSMQAMLDHFGATLNPQDANLKLMLESLKQTFEKFNDAENKFWKALDQNGKK